jgi:gluconate 2-dehydrogenase gamma chain
MTAPGLGDAQTAVLEAGVARLIPSDESGPGAAEAQVARYITRALAGVYRHHRQTYEDGLEAIDGHARSSFDRPFVELASEHQDIVLADAELGRMPGALASQAFFELLLRHTREGMFSDPRWGGNEEQVGWQLLGYPGPRHAWSEEEQRIVERSPQT